MARGVDVNVSGYSGFLNYFSVNPLRLYNFINKYLSNDQDSEDAMSETCLRAMKGLNLFRGELEQSPRAWIYTIAHNASVRELEKRISRKLPPREEREPTPLKGINGEDTEEERIILQIIVRQEVESLPPIYIDVVLASHFQDLSEKEAASDLGIPLATYHSRLYRARRRLEDSLRESFDFAEDHSAH